MAMAAVFTSLALLLALALPAHSGDCVQTIYLKTGDIESAGTDARISVKFYDKNGHSIGESDLQTKGLMDSERDYFERNNLDLFSFATECLPSEICKLKLTHDNGGRYPGWYVSYLKVATSSVYGKCTQREFIINQWLALDEPPNYSVSFTKDLCTSSTINKAEAEADDHNMQHLINLPISSV